ncbi:uncharacterized protein FOMMEDRAFT_164787 [Fomitiporia mediterranea MF3/22]|uniref:uncharacterized protein n=1 Tax=Fomitiporia mediterranea (strain MF3/22) TaxID=694068 RepID=UPI0004409860|nr:uncharacterized protein FOMMEDRAFT_164787 [Fomitiporia mediterranea MF3/22]EJD08007.1 hypothetical protein FOMMEDRAFT_164787 [Fomitiporia mediterranea MF3/22]
MRVKHILNRLSVGERLKLVYERITLTRFTLTFVIVAVIHCLVQIALQTTAFTFNSRAADVLGHIMSQSDVPRQYAFVDNGKLFVCDGVPDGGPSDNVCWPIAGPGVVPPPPDASVGQMDMSFGDDDDDDDDEGPFGDDEDHFEKQDRRSPLELRDLTAVPIVDDSGAVVNVNVTGVDGEDPNQVFQLSPLCVEALNWPNIILHDSRREDIAFLFYQVWLLGISLVTILNESIPHLVAALVMHGLSTGWSGFQVSRTGRYEREYQTLIVNDTCNGVDIIPGFWERRMNYFIPILVLNAVVLAITLGVSLKLFSVYAKQTFNRVGASKRMNVMYSYILLLSVFLQLSAFFTICGSALWIDVMSNGILTGKEGYRVIFTIASVVEFPWVILGWISFRREHRIWSLVFIIIGMLLCAAWTTMFANVLYRWAMQNFPFFATLTITAFIVLVATVILAVICRMHFGRGLPQYLKREETFDDSSFVPVIVPNKRQSKLVSVIFPDKRTSALRRMSDEKKTYTLNPYDRRGQGQWTSPNGSVVDIKPPSGHGHGHRSEVSSVYTTVTSAGASDGHSHGHTTAEQNARERNSIFSRARIPFLRFSDLSKSGMGKLTSRFSAYTSSSSTSDLEGGGMPEVSLPMPLPAAPRKNKASISSTYSAASLARSTMSARMPAPLEEAKIGKATLKSMSIRAVQMPPPTIHVIPASLTRPYPFAEAEAVGGDEVATRPAAAISTPAREEKMEFTTTTSSRSESSYGHARSGSGSSSGSSSGNGSVSGSRSGRSETHIPGIRSSPPGRAFAGLPGNPRVYRS